MNASFYCCSLVFTAQYALSVPRSVHIYCRAIWRQMQKMSINLFGVTTIFPTGQAQELQVGAELILLSPPLSKIAPVSKKKSGSNCFCWLARHINRGNIDTLVKVSVSPPSPSCSLRRLGAARTDPPDSRYCAPLGGQPPMSTPPTTTQSTTLYAAPALLAPARPQDTVHPTYLTLFSTPSPSASHAPSPYLLLAVASQSCPHSPPRTDLYTA